MEPVIAVVVMTVIVTGKPGIKDKAPVKATPQAAPATAAFNVYSNFSDTNNILEFNSRNTI